MGGDEFAILLPEADAAQAAAALERARRAIEHAPFPGGAHLTISVGLCDAAHADDAEALSRFADGALYWSKEHGRNRVSAYDPATIHELSADERIGQLQRSQALTGIRALARAIDARDPSRASTPSASPASPRGWRRSAAGQPTASRCCTRRRSSTTSARSASPTRSCSSRRG